MSPPRSTKLAELNASIESSASVRGASGGRLAVIVDALAGAFSVRETARSVEVTAHLDSADQRLQRAGVDVVTISGSGQLSTFDRQGDPVLQPVGSTRWPALVSEIPAGPVRDLIAGPLGVRALVQFAKSRAEVDVFAVVNGDGKTVARVRWRDVALVSPVRQRLAGSVTVEGLRGYGSEARRVHRLLMQDAAMSPARGSWLDSVRQASGAGQVGARRSAMHPEQPADLAVADALLGYLSVMESTVEGVVADVDTEFLHDFRVAVRRTRSVVKLLGGVLPGGVAARAAGEFRWLGDITTPTRDLDVYQLGIESLASSLTRPEDLAAFGRHLAMRRGAEHQTMKRALRSRRFRELCAWWRSALGDVIAAPPHPGRTVARLANQQLHQAYRKVVKRARAISAESPSEDVHALRKSCKEMRYVLDLFQPLCEPTAYRKVVADFKGLQDVLGEFQDGEVQAAALHVFAGEMLEAGQVDVNAMLAMGELSARFETQQRAAREVLVSHHGDYLGPRSAAHVDRLVPA